MKKPEELLKEYAGELFCMVHSTTCGKIVLAMEEYAEQFKDKREICLCNDPHIPTVNGRCHFCFKPRK